MLATNIEGALNDSNSYIPIALDQTTNGVVYCEKTNFNKINLKTLFESIQADGAGQIKFLVTEFDDKNIEVYLDYAEDAVSANENQYITVYKQFLTLQDDGKWGKNGAYEGYATLKSITGYMQNNNKAVYSIYPNEWQPGAVPILTE
ncbi:MAG: hypothetical protein IJX27_07455 [Clostridia bacterium]|nr:hypothetical protein [Clostridia bacterium]